MSTDPDIGRAIVVVGGTYREVCSEPAINALRGSGVRAAGVLSSLGDRVTLHSCIDDASREEAKAVSVSLGLSGTAWTNRPEAVTFTYSTPVSPAGWRMPATADRLEISADLVVAFGMIETTWTVTGRRIVIDPQHGDLEAMIAAADVEEIAVVLNAHEARRITGHEANEAGQELLTSGVAAVVIKQGAVGGLVFSASGVDSYGVIPTERIQPIGSGDAFTAGFAHVWLTDPTETAEAARHGARVAAGHSLTGMPNVTTALLEGLPEPLAHRLAHRVGRPPCVYLAAPFFSLSDRMLLELVRGALHDSGLEVFSPLHDVGRGGDEVAEEDLTGLQKCDAVLALLDGADPGTIFEIGWATKASIPVVGFTEHPAQHDWTMLRGTGAAVTDDLATAVYRAAWAAITHAHAGGAS